MINERGGPPFASVQLELRGLFGPRCQGSRVSPPGDDRNQQRAFRVQGGDREREGEGRRGRETEHEC